MRAFCHFALVLAASSITICTASAEDVANFYKGRQIQLLIGGNPGVSYDLAGRTIAAHIVKHIPGNPTIKVENMPGASSLIMTNHLYNRAARGRVRQDGVILRVA